MNKKILSLSLALLSLAGIILHQAEAQSTFSDQDTFGEFTSAIEYVADNEIVQGYSDGTYQPLSAINRAEFTKIVVAAAFSQEEIDDCNLTILNRYSDVDQDVWYSPYICLATAEGIIQGYPDGTFKPAGNISFVEAAKIIVNALQLEPNNRTTDLSDPWYAYALTTLSNHQAIPTSISEFSQEINRGEMAEIIYRAHAGIDFKESANYNLTDNSLSQTFISITEPVENYNNSNNREPFKDIDWYSDQITISGQTSSDIRKIVVEFTNGDLEDTYELSQFSLGDTSWTYRARTEFFNLAQGRNQYQIKAYSTSDEVIELRLYVDAAYNETDLDVPPGNEVSVSWNAPVVVDNLEFLNSVNRYDEAVVAYDQTSVLNEAGDSTFLIITKVGTVESGFYADSEMFLINHPCLGMCINSLKQRVLLTKDNQLVIMQKYSNSYLQDSDKKAFNYLFDTETTITNLYPQETITLDNGSRLVRNEEEARLDFVAEIENHTTQDGTDLIRKAPLFYSDAIQGQFYVDETRGCIYTEAADGTYIPYEVDFDFVAQIFETAYEGIRGQIHVLWNDGSETSEFYNYQSHGCDGFSCYDTPSIDNIELEATGQTKTGETVFEEAISEQEATNIENQLNSKATFEDIEPQREAIRVFQSAQWSLPEDTTFEDFLVDHPVIYIQDPFGRNVKFTKQNFVPAVECGKPVIYLYPENTTDVTVKVYPEGGFSITEPEYNDGWTVRATPDSQLYHYDTNSLYPYLFWEGYGIDYQMSEKGFVISDDELESFLVEKLALLGLNEQETADFMEFWVPEMRATEKPFYFVTFVDQAEFDELAPLEVTPEPDKVIRVFMDWQPLDEPQEVEPLEITTPTREGFTVVEWGGALKNDEETN